MSYNLKYKFKGTDTMHISKYEAYGDSALELYNNLVDKGVISTFDGDPYELAVMEKFGMSEDDFLYNDGEVDYESMQDWLEGFEHNLTEEEILTLISEQNGNAYYQTIYIWNELENEYQPI